MKKIILFSLSFFLLRLAYGQDGNIKIDSTREIVRVDSVKKILSRELADTERVNQLVSVSNILLYASNDSEYYNEAGKYANQALTLAQKINFKKGQADAYYHLGLINIKQANYAIALTNYDLALGVEKETGNKVMMGFTYVKIGNVFSEMGSYSNALKNYLDALKIAEVTKDSGLIANANIGLGLVYTRQKNYSDALNCFFISLSIWQKNKDINGVMIANSDIGYIYYKMGNNDESLKYLFNTLKIEKGFGITNKLFNSDVYANIAEIYVEEGKFQDALKTYETVLKIQEEKNYKYGMAGSYLDIGKVYFKLHQYKNAKDYLLDGLAISQENEIKETLKDIYYQLSKIDSATGDINESFQYYKLYTQVKDSIFNESSNKQISLMRIQYETDKKEKEIALLNSENRIKEEEVEKQVIIKYVAVAVSILTILITFLFLYNYRIKEKTRQLTQANVIRQRISRDLHDEIGAGLTSIAMKSERAKVNAPGKSDTDVSVFDKISAQSHSLNEKLSEVVWATNPENDNLVSLISYFRNYVSRFFEDSGIHYTLNLPENIPNISLKPDVSRNLFFVLKEALNNCSKHSHASSIEVLFRVDSNQQFVFFVHDNGRGIDYGVVSAYRNGLGNMRKRIEEINGKFEIETEIGNGTRINIAGSLS